MLLRPFVGLVTLFVMSSALCSAEPEVIAHWPLRNNVDDITGHSAKAEATAVKFELIGPAGSQRTAARFDGEHSIIRVPSSPALKLGADPFSVSAWVYTDGSTTDVPGDILSQYDPATRTGFHLGLYTHGGVTNSQSNSRQLHFGIDQGQIEPDFTDHGRLGNAVYVFSLCVHQGKLYASTCHAGETEAGRVFRFEDGDKWTDLGSPDKANAISAMATHNGELYVASCKYRLSGSALSDSENLNPGGSVFRLGADDKWVPCGKLSAETYSIASLISFNGQLYAGSLYKPAEFYRYEGGEKWTPLATPNGKRVEALTVFNNGLYASCYDEGLVFRFDGKEWAHVGTIPNATQTYGFSVHRGHLYVSEWPLAHVYKYLGGTSWEDVGRLGMELETMPLVVYNGKMYGGTLPLAEVYRYDEGTQWTRVGRVDHTPDVKYRRAWSMAVYQGRLFVGALPSGRVLSIEAGRNATHDHELSAGWHHVAAVRGTDRLTLYVDGQHVSESASLKPGEYNLNSEKPLEIGFGAQDYFHGGLSDLKIYRGALSALQIEQLAKPVQP
jgi:hypothetical protein